MPFCYVLQIESWTPEMVLAPLKQVPANKWTELLWNLLLTACPVWLGAVLLGSDVFHSHNVPAMAAILISGVSVFMAVLAVNKAIHSYLIAKYVARSKVTVEMGFYYMANAMGRVAGTLLSGALYSHAGGSPVAGLGACFVASAAFAAVSSGITLLLDDDVGLACGPCLACLGRAEARQQALVTEEATNAAAAAVQEEHARVSGDVEAAALEAE